MSNALSEAREVLIHGGDLVALAEAIGTIISDPLSSLADIRLGLRHGGIVAEQALLELRRRGAASSDAVASKPIVLAGDEVLDKPTTEAH
jgi:hypothetical protein